MTDKTIREYYGQAINVQYEVKRCIHAQECVRGLAAVFDRGRRPWVLPDAGDADELATVILRCPTGALHFRRKDGGADESVPEHNAIQLRANGPYYVRGDIRIVTPGGEVFLRDTRIALCRCGASQNKPFCDNSHLRIEFREPGLASRAPIVQSRAAGERGGLTIAPEPNGPLRLHGPVELRSVDGEVSFRGSHVSLCRCGASQNKPFCDSSHIRIGFVSE